MKTPHRYVLQGLSGPAWSRVGEHNDCAVKALAVTTGFSYDDCHAFFELHGRKRGRGTFCYEILTGTSYKQAEKAFPELGFKVTRNGGFPLPASPSPDWVLDSTTLRSFCRSHPVGAYFITVRRHALSVRDGVIYDYTCGDLRRICDVWKVELL